mmetsp:Transcript_8246/g.19877  ORF Transcript_8246/g.19877 Transcript_8246/m.19877 type:complete len:670 (+) Transcript_8246:186-2195(+)
MAKARSSPPGVSSDRNTIKKSCDDEQDFFDFLHTTQLAPLNFHQLALYLCLLEGEEADGAEEAIPGAHHDDHDHEQDEDLQLRHRHASAAGKGGVVSPEAIQETTNTKSRHLLSAELLLKREARTNGARRWLCASLTMVIAQVLTVQAILSASSNPTCSDESAAVCPLGMWCKPSLGFCSWCVPWYKPLCDEFLDGAAWEQHVEREISAATSTIIPSSSPPSTIPSASYFGTKEFQEHLYETYFAPRKLKAETDWGRTRDGASRALKIEEIPAMCWRCSAGLHQPNVEKHVATTVSRMTQLDAVNVTAAAQSTIVKPFATTQFEERRRMHDTVLASVHALSELRPDGYFVIFMSSVVVALAICRELADVLLCELTLERRFHGEMKSRVSALTEDVESLQRLPPGAPGPGDDIHGAEGPGTISTSSGTSLGGPLAQTALEVDDLQEEQNNAPPRPRGAAPTNRTATSAARRRPSPPTSSTTTVRLLKLCCILRRFAVIPLLIVTIPKLVIHQGRDSLAICLNAVAVLFLLEIDNFAYSQGVSAKLKAAFELTGHLRLSDKDCYRMMVRNRVYFVLVPCTVVLLIVLMQISVRTNDDEQLDAEAMKHHLVLRMSRHFLMIFLASSIPGFLEDWFVGHSSRSTRWDHTKNFVVRAGIAYVTVGVSALWTWVR